MIEAPADIATELEQEKARLRTLRVELADAEAALNRWLKDRTTDGACDAVRFNLDNQRTEKVKAVSTHGWEVQEGRLRADVRSLAAQVDESQRRIRLLRLQAPEGSKVRLQLCRCESAGGVSLSSQRATTGTVISTLGPIAEVRLDTPHDARNDKAQILETVYCRFAALNFLD